MFATERLYLNAGKDRVVPEGHKDAAYLWAAEGDEIPDEAAARFGLVDGTTKKRAAERSKEAAKAAAREENETGGDGGSGGKGGEPDGDKEKKPEGDKSKGGLTIKKQARG